jgi:hypothetical protein
MRSKMTLVFAAVVCAFAASATRALAHEYKAALEGTASSATTKIEINSKNFVNCTTVIYAWAAQAGKEFKVSPSYSGCTATADGIKAEKVTVTVKEGCLFTLEEPKPLKEEHHFTANLSVPASCAIQVTIVVGGVQVCTMRAGAAVIVVTQFRDAPLRFYVTVTEQSLPYTVKSGCLGIESSGKAKDSEKFDTEGIEIT